MRLIFILIMLVSVIGMNLQELQPLLTTYRELSYLGYNGINVTKDVELLNEAINLATHGNYTGSQLILEQINRDIKSLAVSNYLSIFHMFLPAIVSVVIIALILILYIRREKVIGSIVLRLRGNNKVLRGSGKPRTSYLNEDVIAVVAGIVVVLLISVSFYPILHRSAIQPYSAIALLNPHGTIGGYPSIVYIQQPLNVGIYVFNSMGRPIWYVVNIYVVNSSIANVTGIPANVTPIIILNRVLLNNETWITYITLSINETGSYRIYAVLYMYDPTNLELKYLAYTALLVNVTKPYTT